MKVSAVLSVDVMKLHALNSELYDLNSEYKKKQDELMVLKSKVIRNSLFKDWAEVEFSDDFTVLIGVKEFSLVCVGAHK